jgi:hypothetical protein
MTFRTTEVERGSRIHDSREGDGSRLVYSSWPDPAHAVPRPTSFGGVAAPAAGVELVEVSMLLGHSELRVTADLYSHL